MYKAIVRKQVRSVFEEINKGDYMTMVNGLAPTFEYQFHGQHCLGGRRNRKESMILWWQRIQTILPGAQFTIHEVLVNGFPWNTRIAIRATVSGDLPSTTNERYENTVFQFMTIKWGKVASVETLEDLQVLERALSIVATSGNTVALAAPLIDAPLINP